VLFKSAEYVSRALTLHDAVFRKRELRVQTCGKRTKRTEARKAGVDTGRERKSFAGKAASAAVINSTNAMKRLDKKVTHMCVRLVREYVTRRFVCRGVGPLLGVKTKRSQRPSSWAE
jgi:hypothetical protein